MNTRIYKVVFLLAAIFISATLKAQNVYHNDQPLAHTFSIIARDSVTGEMAVGVQSHWFSVGTLVSWGKSGVGVVATQSFVNPAFGPEGLKLMSEGISAEEALNNLVSADDGRDFRQVAFLDAKGNVNAFTGEKCIASASHQVGNNYSVQANMMMNDKVVPAMARTFEENTDLPLAERILKVLQAAQNAGGDIRGKQSAVLIVVSIEPVDQPWLDKKIDLRVDDHMEPIEELDRLLRVHRAYEHMNLGDLAIEHGDMKKALEEYGAAEQMFPDNLEMRYWKAVAMANNGQVKESLPIFKSIFESDSNWLDLTMRLPASGLLTVSVTDLKKIIGL